MTELKLPGDVQLTLDAHPELLLDPPEPVVEQKPVEFDTDAANAAGDEGMGRARRAERVQDWKMEAAQWISQCPRWSEFTADDLILAVGLPDEGVNRNNVVGALISSWSKAGHIEWTGAFRKSARVIRHGNPQRVWRKT